MKTILNRKDYLLLLEAIGMLEEDYGGNHPEKKRLAEIKEYIKKLLGKRAPLA